MLAEPVAAEGPMPLISSHSNTRVKQVRALRQRKERERTGLFFVEGIRLVGEAVQTGAEIETLVVAPERLTSTFGQELVERQSQRGVAYLEVTAEVFEGISSRKGPQGIGAVVRQRWAALADVTPGDELCWTALVAVQDPGNLGSVLRVSDAVGGAGVILIGASTDPYDPAAVRGSMGAVFSQQLVRTGFEDFRAWKEASPYAAAGTAGDAPHDYQAVRYPRPLILLMGSEREGLSPQQRAVCDVMVRIPMVGRSDSLNLAVATGVVLYEIVNQRRAGQREGTGIGSP